MNHKNLIFMVVKQLKMKNLLTENLMLIKLKIEIGKRNKSIENVED